MRRALDAADLVDAVLRFTRELRRRGVRVHPAASRVALGALVEVDLSMREDFRAALRLTLVHRPEDLPLFDLVFEAFWKTQPPSGDGDRANAAFEDRSSPRPGGPEMDDRAPDEPGAPSLSRAATVASGEIADAEEDGLAPTVESAAVGVTIGGDVVPGPGSGEAAELDRLARSLGPLLATRVSRRWTPDSSGRAIDFRRSLRASLRHGGVPVPLPRRRRRLTRTRIVLFCDVSRSMDEHAALLLRFSAAVLRRLSRVEVFLFASDLVRVTPIWLRETWADLKLRVPDCGGGTRIGECLTGFLVDYETALLDRGTIVVILSDGLDAGEPETLDRALAAIGRRAHAVFWLNPLAATPGYEPTARGMAAALPHVDVFAPGHDLGSLWTLAERLRSFATRRRRMAA